MGPYREPGEVPPHTCRWTLSCGWWPDCVDHGLEWECRECGAEAPWYLRWALSTQQLLIWVTEWDG